MRIDKHTKLADFLFYAEVFNISEDLINELFEKLDKYKPSKDYNISFNALKLKQLIDLQTKIKTSLDFLFIPFSVVHNISRNEVLKMTAFDCFSFSLHAKKELERIAKLFNAIEYKPSPDEVKAGIKNINHGAFGMIDWYAKRMGIKDHDEVAELSWVRIYECLKIDFDNNMFEKRYRKVITKNR